MFKKSQITLNVELFIISVCLALPLSVLASKPLNSKTTAVKVLLFDHYSKQISDFGAYFSFNPAAGSNISALDCADMETEMVKEQLNLDRVPVLNKIVPCPSHEDLNKWFREDPFNPLETKRVIKYQQELIFQNIGNDRLHLIDAKFFPLDGKPGNLIEAGIEQLTKTQDNSFHNMGFTMHIKSSFTYQSKNAKSMDITFTGGDDFWVFIDGKLVVDFGGFHNKSAPKFTLKDKMDEGILDLKEGSDYNIDIFYAKRHTHNTNFNLKIHRLLLFSVKKKLTYQIFK